MDDSKHDDRSAGHTKNGSVITVDEMPISSSHQLVFGDERALLRKALPRGQLLVQLPQESVGGIGAGLRDEAPDFFGIGFGRTGYLNEELCGHA